MSTVRVDHIRLAELSQILSANLNAPRDAVDALDDWAKSIESNEALVTLDDLKYAERIRLVRSYMSSSIDGMECVAKAIGEVAAIYSQRDEWARRLLSDSPEQLLEFLDKDYWKEESSRATPRQEYTVIDSEFFRFKIHGSNYAAESGADAGDYDKNVEVNAGIKVQGPSAGGTVEFGPRDSSVFVSYEASGPGVEVRAKGHAGTSGAGGTAGAQAQAWGASVGVGVRTDERTTEVKANVGASVGSVVTENVNLDEGTIDLNATVAGTGVQVTSKPNKQR